MYIAFYFFGQACTDLFMRVQVHGQGDSVDVASPGMYQIGAGGLTPHSQGCHTCGAHRETSRRTDVDRMFDMLVDRVTRLEETMDNVVGGISNILWELEGIGRYVRDKGGVQTTPHSVHVQAAHVDVSTSTPFEWEQGNKQSNGCDANMDVAPPTCSQKELVREADEPHRASPTRPNVVDLDIVSSPSGDMTVKGNGKNPIPDTLAKRVRSQPRMRVVPCATTVLAVGASAGGTSGAIPYTPKYRDPPGYEDVADFEKKSREHYYKPPLLSPKNHGVSCCPHQVHLNLTQNVFFFVILKIGVNKY